MSRKSIFWFSFFNFALWCVMSLRYYFVGGFFGGAAGVIFTFLSITGHFTVLFLTLYLLLMACSLVGPKTARWTGVTLGSLLIFGLLADIIVYSQYRFHINPAMIELFLGPAGREIFDFSFLMYFFAVLIAALIITAEILLSRISGKIKLGFKKAVLIISALLICLVSYHVMHACGKFFAVTSVTGQVSYLPFAHPVSMNSFLRKMGFSPKAPVVKASKRSALNYPAAPLNCEMKDKPNILIILVDSLRFDVFNAEVMPNSYARYKNSKNAVYFTNHISGGNATQSGVFSLFYALPSVYWDTFISSAKEPVFMSLAWQNGYVPAIYSSGRLDSPEFNKNVFLGVKDLRVESQGASKPARDIDMQQDFEKFLKTRDKNKPFLGFLFYDSAHGFAYPPDFKEKFTPVKEMNYIFMSAGMDPAPYFNKYKNAVHFADSLLGSVYKMLDAQGLAENTIVILTADHGQEINDTGNNFWGHNSSFDRYQIQVPLVIWRPGKSGGEINYRTSHHDIVPTLMAEVFGCANPPSDYSIGQNLFAPPEKPYDIAVSYNKKAVVEGDVITVMDNYGAMETYDMEFRKQKSTVSPASINSALDDLSGFYR